MKDWSKLNKWADYLNKERDIATDKVETLCVDKDSLPQAIEDIELDYISIKRHLKEIFNHDWDLEDDLSPVENLSDNIFYSNICERIGHHLRLIRSVHEDITNGVFIQNPIKYIS